MSPEIPTELRPTHAEIAAYMANVANALREQVLPSVQEDNSKQRLRESIALLARISVGLDPNADLIGVSEREALAAMESRALALASGANAVERAAAPQITPAMMRNYLSALSKEDVVVDELILLAGGRSKKTYLVKQHGCAALPEQFVIRQDNAESMLDGSVREEFKLLRYLEREKITAPKVLRLEPGESVLGAPLMIVERLAGKNQGGLFDPPNLPEVVLQFARQLGRLHALCPTPADELPPLATRAAGHDLLREELGAIEGLITQLAKHSATFPAALKWLRDNIDRVTGPTTLVHGDCGFHNFLATENDLTGILDWELAHFGNPAEDLGYVRPWASQVVPWEDFLRAYHDAGGPESTPFSVDFYTLWGDVRICSILLRARAGIVSRQISDFELTVVSGHLLWNTLTRTAADLEHILRRHC